MPGRRWRERGWVDQVGNGPDALANLAPASDEPAARVRAAWTAWESGDGSNLPGWRSRSDDFNSDCDMGRADGKGFIVTTVNVGTSPTTLSDGTAAFVTVLNSGAANLALSGALTQVLRPKQSVRVTLQGVALLGASSPGTTVEVTVAAADVNPAGVTDAAVADKVANGTLTGAALSASIAGLGWRGFDGTGGTQGTIGAGWEATFESIGSSVVVTNRTAGSVVEVFIAVNALDDPAPSQVVFDLSEPGFSPSLPIVPMNVTGADLDVQVQPSGDGFAIVIAGSGVDFQAHAVFTTRDSALDPNNLPGSADPF